MEWFTEGELEEQLSELLVAYRSFHLEGHKMKGDEKKDFKEKAKLAIDTFRAMFGDKLEDDDMLVEQHEEDILETLKFWVQEACPALKRAGDAEDHGAVDIGDGNEDDPDELDHLSSQAFADAEQCSRHLMRLSSEGDASDVQGLWPFIKKIEWVNAVSGCQRAANTKQRVS